MIAALIGTRGGIAGRIRPSARLILLLGLVAAAASGQHLPLKTFTGADGLAHDQINKIVRDSSGFLWIGTVEGLSRFDGYTFRDYGVNEGLPSPDVNDILETRRGDYWVATSGGLVRFNTKGRPQSHVSYINDAESAYAMFAVVRPGDDNHDAAATNVLLEDRSGRIWVGTLNGLYSLEQSGGRYFLRAVDVGLPNEYSEQRLINDLTQDREGMLWIASPSGLYRRTPDGRVDHFTKKDGLPSAYLHCLLQDHEGRLWAGTRQAGFFRFQVESGHRVRVFPSGTDRDSGASWIYQLFETSDRRLWAASNVGLIEYSAGTEAGLSFRVYTTQNGESLHDITTLGEDLDGNLWIGTNGDGLARMAREGFMVYGEREGIATADAFFEEAGGICVRGYRAAETHGEMVHMFGCFENERPRWFIPAALRKTYLGWVSQHVTLKAASGEWWIGTGEGLYRFPAVQRFRDLSAARPLAVYTKRDGLASLQVYYLFQDSRGGIWISTTASGSNGLSVWDPDTGRIRNLEGTAGLSSLKTDLARTFAEDRGGNVWIGFGAGMVRYHGGKFQVYATKGGRPLGGVQEIHCDQEGRLWVASALAGLIRVDHPEAESPEFAAYTTAEGLSSSRVKLIAEDLEGRLYVGTGRALDVLDPANGRVKHLTAAHGLPSLAFRTTFRDRRGRLWFGAGRGISLFTPGRNKSPVPKTFITGLRISGRSLSISALSETELFVPALSAAENQVQVDFAGVSFEPGEATRYRYKLESADTDWSAPTALRTVNYAELRPGKYRFLVRAENSDGLASPTPASVTFEILPPLWQRWWFLLGAAILAGSLAYGLHRYHVLRLLEIERLRTRIAADLHDDIGSNLTQIAILSEVANRKLSTENASVGDILSSVARISRDSVASMSDIVWAINPKRDSLLDLVRRMKRFTNEVVAPREIQLGWRALDVDEDVKLGAEVRRDVFLVFKEVINNAVRHSACTRLDIELRVEDGHLVLRIADDGRGFDPSAAHGGHGLDNMRRRAVNLHGQLRIDASSGGTTVGLSIPLRAHAIPPRQIR